MIAYRIAHWWLLNWSCVCEQIAHIAFYMNSTEHEFVFTDRTIYVYVADKRKINATRSISTHTTIFARILWTWNVHGLFVFNLISDDKMNRNQLRPKRRTQNAVLDSKTAFCVNPSKSSNWSSENYTGLCMK